MWCNGHKGILYIILFLQFVEYADTALLFICVYCWERWNKTVAKKEIIWMRHNSRIPTFCLVAGRWNTRAAWFFFFFSYIKKGSKFACYCWLYLLNTVKYHKMLVCFYCVLQRTLYVHILWQNENIWETRDGAYVLCASSNVSLLF